MYQGGIKMADEIKCIDVSTWQGDIDWAKVKKAGYAHAIIRAGFGRESSQVDNKFERNYKNAKAAGVKLGAYWYSYADSVEDAKREAAACLEVLKGKTLQMPVFFDMEESFQTKFGKLTLTNMAKAFCDAIIKGGFRAGVYSNLNWFSNYLDFESLRKIYPVWLAQYNTEAQLPCDIWQYSSSGKVSGIEGSVDMNIIYNPDVVKSDKPKTDYVAREELKVGDKGLDVLCLKTLLLIAHDMKLCTVRMTHGTDYAGPGMGTAINECRKAMGLHKSEVADKEFVTELYTAIQERYPVPGDFNGDGEINIRDATDIQRRLAGIE